jgi:hypothetical protein
MPRSAQKKHVPAFINPMSSVKPTSMLSTVKDGFSFGVGSAIAHRVVGGLFGSGQVQPQSQSQSQPPLRNREYEQCLSEHSNVVDGTAFCAYLLREAKDTEKQNK